MARSHPTELTPEPTVLLPKNGILYGNLLKKIQTERLYLASIEGRDIALIELENTYAELKKELQIEPYLLSKSSHLKKGDKLEILDSYHEKIHRCIFDHFSESFVAAGPYAWTDVLVLKNCQAKTSTGTSGAGVIQSGTKKLVGLHNSSNHDKDSACDTGNACEYNQHGHNISKEDDAYSQNLDFLFSCFNDNFEIDTSLCRLPF